MAKTTPEQNAEIAKRYALGESSVRLAPDYGVSDVTICNILKRMGVTVRKCNDKTKNLVVEDVVSSYANGESSNKIAKRYGVSHGAVTKLLADNGVATRDKTAAALPQVRFNVCVVCGETFRPKSKWTDTTSHSRKTCSPECKRIHAGRVAKDKHMTHGGSQIRYQRIAREIKEQKCEECGAIDIRLDVHHIDHNKSNNNPDNLRMLCVRCHARFHYYNGDVNIRGAPRKCEA